MAHIMQGNYRVLKRTDYDPQQKDWTIYTHLHDLAHYKQGTMIQNTRRKYFLCRKGATVMYSTISFVLSGTRFSPDRNFELFRNVFTV